MRFHLAPSFASFVKKVFVRARLGHNLDVGSCVVKMSVISLSSECSDSCPTLKSSAHSDLADSGDHFRRNIHGQGQQITAAQAVTSRPRCNSSLIQYAGEKNKTRGRTQAVAERSYCARLSDCKGNAEQSCAWCRNVLPHSGLTDDNVFNPARGGQCRAC